MNRFNSYPGSFVNNYDFSSLYQTPKTTPEKVVETNPRNQKTYDAAKEKTILCWLALKGKCLNRDVCHYAHNSGELSLSKFSDKYKTQPCRTNGVLQNNWTCRFHYNCSYFHQDDLLKYNEATGTLEVWGPDYSRGGVLIKYREGYVNGVLPVSGEHK